MASANVQLATRAQAVRALGLRSPRALDRLIERGAPGPAPGKRGGARYDVEAIAKWRTERLARSTPSTNINTERAALMKIQRESAAIELRKKKGELVKAADAIDALKSIASAVRAEMLTLSRRAVLAGLPAEHEPLIRRLIVDALRELADLRSLEALSRKTPGTAA